MLRTDVDLKCSEVRNINGQRICDMSDDRTAIVIRRKNAITVIHIVDGHLVVENVETAA